MRNAIFLSMFLFLCNCKDDEIQTADDINSGGNTSVDGAFIKIFQQPAANLNAEQAALHFKADAAFGDIFVSAPSAINPGLGPLFNQSSCESCHVSNGASPFPTATNDTRGLLIRMSTDGKGINDEPLPVAGFGNQLHTRSIYNIKPEAKLSWQEIKSIESFIDGEQVAMTNYLFFIKDAYFPLPADVKLSPRIAPKIIGLGLLEAISEIDILKNADINDTNKDGISGKPNYVWNYKNNRKELGRFGWKLNQPNLLQQTAAAYNGDMGITSSYFSNQNCDGQQQCSNEKNEAEIDDETLKFATFYTQSLAVPTRRNSENAQVQKGKMLFTKIGCNNCHITSFVTSSHPEYSFLSKQKINPYTDLLLHDMGSDLADNRPDFEADGNEWRTAPLWGLGLAKTVGGENIGYLHDGRAKSIKEAILWHSGEGGTSKNKFKILSEEERSALLVFLEGL